MASEQVTVGVPSPTSSLRERASACHSGCCSCCSGHDGPSLGLTDEALKEAVEELVSVKCVSVSFLARGGFHEVWIGQLDSAGAVAAGIPDEMILRIALPSSSAQHVMDSEVATIEHLRREGFPAPQVFAWCSDPLKSGLGHSYMIMRKMPGARAHNCWEEMPFASKRHLALQLADLLHRLFLLRFESTGSLQFAPDDGRPIDKRAIHVGPGVWRDKQWSAGLPPPWPYNDGPFSSLTDHLASGSLALVEFLGRAPVQAAQWAKEVIAHLPSIPQTADEWVQQAPALLGEMADASTWVQRAVQDLGLWPDGPAFCLTHPDLNLTNVLIDPQTGDILTVLDWDGASTVPLFLACDVPYWVERPLPEGYRNPIGRFPSLPDDWDTKERLHRLFASRVSELSAADGDMDLWRRCHYLTPHALSGCMWMTNWDWSILRLGRASRRLRYFYFILTRAIQTRQYGQDSEMLLQEIEDDLVDMSHWADSQRHRTTDCGSHGLNSSPVQNGIDDCKTPETDTNLPSIVPSAAVEAAQAHSARADACWREMPFEAKKRFVLEVADLVYTLFHTEPPYPSQFDVHFHPFTIQINWPQESDPTPPQPSWMANVVRGQAGAGRALERIAEVCDELALLLLPTNKLHLSIDPQLRDFVVDRRTGAIVEAVLLKTAVRPAWKAAEIPSWIRLEDCKAGPGDPIAHELETALLGSAYLTRMAELDDSNGSDGRWLEALRTGRPLRDIEKMLASDPLLEDLVDAKSFARSISAKLVETSVAADCEALFSSALSWELFSDSDDGSVDEDSDDASSEDSVEASKARSDE